MKSFYHRGLHHFKMSDFTQSSGLIHLLTVLLNVLNISDKSHTLVSEGQREAELAT